ncbi:uncharacterized protein BCR38DRAFT_348473, partial [Pseudomassariella vexata]
WCLFAEITNIMSLFRLTLTVQDVAGALLAVSFYTKDRGMELPHPTRQPGRTITIVFPIWHRFLDMTMGICELLIIPLIVSQDLVCDLIRVGIKNCQVTGWKEKGHKDNGKLLKDGDLKRMFQLGWSNFDEPL